MKYRQRKPCEIILPSGRYRVVGSRRSPAAAARAAHAAGQQWTSFGGRFLLIEPAEGAGR